MLVGRGTAGRLFFQTVKEATLRVYRPMLYRLRRMDRTVVGRLGIRVPPGRPRGNEQVHALNPLITDATVLR